MRSCGRRTSKSKDEGGRMKRYRRPLIILGFLFAAAPAALRVAFADRAAATQPSTRPSELTENVTGAKGLDAALRNLHASMRETDPLPPREALKEFRPQDGYAM